MRCDWLNYESFQHVLAALMPQNRLVMRACLHSGLRVSDVLELRSSRMSQRMTVRELKTGKSKRVYWKSELYNELLENSGKIWVFEHRTNPKKHRTRQAVWHDIQRAAELFRVSGVVPRGAVISPHSARKAYAVEMFHKQGNLAAVGKVLNHDKQNVEVTALYAMADVLTAQKLEKRGRKNGSKLCDKANKKARA